MKKLAIIRHKTRKWGGEYQNILEKKGIDFEIFFLDKPEVSVPNLENFNAILSMGGPDSANDHLQQVQKSLRVARYALEKNIPYFGVCLGLQTLVKAGGGGVTKAPLRELGFYGPDSKKFMVSLTPQGITDPLLKNYPQTFPVFHMHDEMVLLTNKMQLLGTGKFCEPQIVKVGTKAYGVQYHNELVPKMFNDWVTEDPAFQTMDRTKLDQAYQSSEKEFKQLSDLIFNNFLDLANF